MGKSTLQNLLYKIEGYSDTPEFIIKQYKECDGGIIYLELQQANVLQSECKCGHQCGNAANAAGATESPNAPNATASGGTETSGGNATTGNEAAKMGA